MLDCTFNVSGCAWLVFVQLVRGWSSGGNRPGSDGRRTDTSFFFGSWTRRKASEAAFQFAVSSLESSWRRADTVRWCWRKISRWLKCRYLRWRGKWMSRESPKRWGRCLLFCQSNFFSPQRKNTLTRYSSLITCCFLFCCVIVPVHGLVVKVNRDVRWAR